VRPIVCATRGGEASRRTQERAIALAKEQKSGLIFLYIADPSFAGPVSEALAAALTDELTWLGKSLLWIAQARAQRQGLEAQTVVRHGAVWPTLEDYLRQVNASTLVIGSPRTGALHTFTPEKIQRLAQAVRQATDVEVVVVK
jgi:nucleotide-binding universal stress UspA family protein